MLSALNYPEVSIFEKATSIFYKYLVYFYTAIMFLGCGEIAPVSVGSYATAIFILYLGNFVNLFFLGKASNIIETWLTES